MTIKLTRAWLAFILLLPAYNALAKLSVTDIASNAFNGEINGVSFQQDAITTYNGYQYAVYWSANRHVAVARRALPAGQWQSFELRDYTFQTNNAHYDISLGISPRDGTLHLSFYQWSSVFNYRKSVPGVVTNPQSVNWGPQLFNANQNGLLGPTMGPTTYPRFVTQPDGKLLFLLRHGSSGSGDSFLYEYDGNTGQWTGLGKFVDGLATDINAYFNGIHYDANGRLHATWVWRGTPDATTNFDLHYVYSDDDGRTWYDNSGRYVATTGSSPINQYTPGTVVWQIGQNRGLINQEAQAVDAEGRVSMLMSHMADGEPSSTDFAANRLKARVFHYMRDLSGQWRRQQLPGSSFSYDRNKIAADSQGNLYAVVNRDGIYKATAANNWTDWHLVMPVTDQTIFREVQLDRQRLMEEDILDFIHITTQGTMRLFSFDDQSERSPSAAGGGPEGFVYCAGESQSCNFSGTKDVVYGAAGRFYLQRANGQITCSNNVFGEPNRGVVKRCYYSQETSQGEGPAGYSLCAEEDQTCAVSETSNVAYGAQGAFNFRLTSSAITCSNAEFGDPISGVGKRCYVKPVVQGTVVSSSSSEQSSSQASSSPVSSSASVSSSESVSSSSSSQSSTPVRTGGASPFSILALLAFALFARVYFQTRK